MGSETREDLGELLRRARSGSGLALGQLLERYRNYLGLMAHCQLGRRLQGKVDGSDLVQETFLEAQRDFPQFAGASEAELLAWLRRIMARNVANHMQHYMGTKRRNIRLERQLVDELDQSSRVLDRGLLTQHASPSQQAARREQAVLLADALERLPVNYREILVLRHLDGLTFPEIAQRLGRSLDSIKNLWARGLAKLRHNLGDAP